MTSPPEPFPKQQALPTRRLWAVRGAAIVTLLLLYVPSPPWEWLENPFPLFLIVPLSILFLAVLWRLRKTSYKDGLALAMAVGGSYSSWPGSASSSP